jgi:HEAT repeat protein
MMIQPGDGIQHKKMGSALTFALGIMCLFSGSVWAKEPRDAAVLQAQRAYEQGQYQQVVDLVKPLLEDTSTPSQVSRLHILALAGLGKTAEALDAYEKGISVTKQEDESLLRQTAIASILPLRFDMREQFRGAAYTALKEIDSDNVVEYLEEGLADESGMIRTLAAEALGKRKAGQRSTRFQESLKDGAGLVRSTVLIGLGQSGDESLVPMIERSLNDEQHLVQIAAARALFELGHKHYWARLEQGAQSQEGYERGAAIRAFGELEDRRAIPILEKTISDDQPSIRAAAIASLGKLKGPESLPTLKAALFDRIPAVRSVAAFSMGYFEQHQVLTPLTRALADSNPGVQAAAVASLLRVGASYGVVKDTVQQLLNDQNPAIRSGVVKALGNGKGRDVIAALIFALNDPLPRPRIVAVRALGRTGDRTHLPVLKRTLRDTDEAVRVTAAAAIVTILDKKIGI